MQLKTNRKKTIKAIVLIGLCLILSFTPITQQFISNGGKDEKIHDNIIPNQSEMRYSFIHIDDNWTETVVSYDWCSGSGSWNDPFIIENVDIFTNASIAGIFINNSQNVYFKIENCIISNNSTETFSAGIRLENTTNGRILNISSYQNKVGIMFINTHNISIEESDVFSNNYGICIWQSSSDNSLYENDIFDNTVQGVNITNCNDNNVYNNNFYNNTVNAVDSGINNVWNKGNQGNYWDDYGGKDIDDDGIGDTPYIISGSTGSQDNYPIWWDAPVITVISPVPYSLYGSLPPNFSVHLEEGLSHSWWYMIDSNTTKNYFTTNGSIDAEIWSLLVNGSHNIFFYVNDSRGYEDYEAITIYKDIETPSIDIIYPVNHSIFGDSPCNFTIIILESNLNSTWYTLNNGSIIYFNGIFGQNNDVISQSEWELQSNGTIIIAFFANDTMGNIGKNNVTVYKDIIAPIITINNPNPYELFGASKPECYVLFEDINGVDAKWYQLTDGITTTSIREWTDTIHIDDWNAMSNGTVTIIFYANDTMGNIGMANVSLYKDIIGPNILINEPHQYDLVSTVPPICVVIIDDINGVNASWYQLSNGTFTTISRTWNGSIDINDWNMMANGSINIEFFANDSLGNINSEGVVVYKDIISPYIAINEPKSHDIFRQIPPDCNLTLYDINSIDHVWYQLTDGITTTSIREWTDTIHIDDWNAMSNGTVTIIFYANDTVGNIAMANVSVYKDIIAPVITINSPNPYEVFGTSQPECNVLFEDINGVDAKWYQLTAGITTTSIREWTDTIHIDDWNAMSNGTVTIIFYANDTVGNIAMTNVSVYKDIIAPVITINSPNPYEVFGVSEPECDVLFEDINGVDTKWYQLTDGITTTNIREWTDTIHIDDWNAMSNGTVTIIFYANDALGNVGSENVSVYKDSLSPIITIHDPEDGELFGIPSPIINMSVYDDHLESVWYHLDNGSVETAYRLWIGFIYQEDWDQIGNGTVILRFIAYDSVNNLASISLLLRKCIFDPIIIIVDPVDDELFGSVPPDITLYNSSAEIDTIWYRLYNSTFSTVNITWGGSIKMSAWDTFGNGTVSITFYINDTLGNMGFDSVNLRKDIILPIVNISSPLPYELFGTTPPSVSVSFYDENSISSIYYQLKNLAVTTPLRSWTGTIIPSDWKLMVNGTVTIVFRAEDMVGNVAFANITVRKDIIAPEIVIYYPEDNDLYGYQRPLVYFFIDEDSGVSEISYQLTSDIFSSSIRDWNGSIDQALWDQFGNGTITIYFYATDVIGNEGIASVMVRKDIIAPSILIQSPAQYQRVGRESPFFEVYITDGNLLSCWYVIIGTNVNVSFSGPFGRIDQTLWESVWDNTIVDGNIIIRFYAQDRMKNLNYSVLFLVKDITPEPDVPTPFLIDLTDLFFLGCLGAVAISLPLIIKKSRVYGSSNPKQKKVLQRVIILTIILLGLISVVIITT